MSAPGHLGAPLRSVVARLSNPSDKLVQANKYMQAHGDWVALILKQVPGAMDPSINMGSVNNKNFKKLGNPNPIGSQVWGSKPLDGAMFQDILINHKAPEDAWKSTYTQAGQLAADFLKANPGWKPVA